MANEEIKRAAASSGVKMWQIAAEYGMMDCNFSRKLRNELPLDEKEKILSIIRKLSVRDDICYEAINAAVLDDDFREQMLTAARYELLAFRAKYSHLDELSKIMDDIDSVIN